MLKKITLGLSVTALMGMSVAALAGDIDTAATNDAGVYVKAEGGYGWSNIANQTIEQTDTGITFGMRDIQNSHFTGRVAAGYAFNPYIALEAGFALYPSFSNVISMKQGNNYLDNAISQKVDGIYSADLMAMGTLPIDNFFVSAGAGAAYVHESFGDTTSVVGSTLNANAHTAGYIRPKATAAVGYNVTPQLAVDVSYSRVFGTGKLSVDSNYLPSFNTTMAGLIWKF